ncbi:hypothetical protein AH70_07350 [Pediococcus damnosus LMG 28219]|uniref:hypothetical protein n=1 Tax=Pediococcus damnosus TaxID=51663 RepID=UPI00061F8717|nr:hypothetical protein [Pediococcus damnosus]AMV60818.1 Hypothetical protein ADU69_1159 [Pediococcus damnosus]AMV65128.1 Hypothetical protein ADU71_1232 [Pediococcus damnosus]AMV69939.1 Hypothetical protein ADU73_1547 [Pediococcus damnosus]KJU74311.1 hypothetical protein AH70_07350 [Pediococcus damnosus LMG 28219]PIO81639.1 hypothetical protein BSQ38_08240 [Pediococcus damnosus]
MIAKFKYKLSGVMLANIFLEILTVMFFGDNLQLQIPTLINFWGHPVSEFTAANGDQMTSLVMVLIVFFVAEILIGLVSFTMNNHTRDEFCFHIPAFLDVLNVKLWNLSLLDGLVIWLIGQSWAFVAIAFEAFAIATSLAVIFNLVFLLFIVGTVVANVGIHQKHRLS